MSAASAETDEANHNQENSACVNMESVHRIAKLPVVESTIQTATNIYGKVKDFNSVTNWTLQTAEDTMHKAYEVGKPVASPVVSKLEGPIKKVDDIICTGLDYVESKVPAIKQPPAEIYTSTKEYVSSTVTPAVETACAYVKPVLDTALHVVDPAVQSAKTVVEPAVQTAMHLVEPYVQQVEEFLHLKHAGDGKALECNECQENGGKNDAPKE